MNEINKFTSDEKDVYKKIKLSFDKTKYPPQLKIYLSNNSEEINDKVIGLRVKAIDLSFPKLIITGEIIDYNSTDSPYLYDVLIDFDCFENHNEEERKNHNYQPYAAAYYTRSELQVI